MSQKIRVRRIVASLSANGGPCAGETNADAPTLPGCRAALTGAPNYQKILKEPVPFANTGFGAILRKLSVAASAFVPIVGPLLAVGVNAADSATFDETGKVAPLSAPPPLSTRANVGVTNSGGAIATRSPNFGDLFSFLQPVNPAGGSLPGGSTFAATTDGGVTLLPSGMLLPLGILAFVLFLLFVGRK